MTASAPAPRTSLRTRAVRAATAALLAAALAIVGALVLPASAASALSAQDGRAQILKELNAKRTAAGLRPLKESAGLESVAQKWSQKMSDARRMSHNPKTGSLIPRGWRSWGENVAWSRGFANNATIIHRGWVDSPPHFRNMMSATFTHIGIGYVETAAGGAYATEVFGTYPQGATARVTKLSRKTLRAHRTARLTIRGKHLSGVTRVRVGGKNAKILRKTRSKVVVRVPKLRAGTAQVRLRNGFGWSAQSGSSALIVRP